MVLAIRRHASYANVVATMALVFAMGGSAIAAKHYLLNSTSQINPKVLTALEAKIASRVKPGATGKEGPSGREGQVGKEGTAGKEGSSLLSQSEQETLKAILPYVKYVASGVGGKPTIQLSGANLQIFSGAGAEATINGAGNLVVGYDPEPGAQTGSNNIVIGGGSQAYTSYGSMVGGESNVDSAPFSALFGFRNTTSGPFSSVTGGNKNTASGSTSSVSGGSENKASNESSAVGGGFKNTAAFSLSSIFGGKELTTSETFQAIP